MICIGWDVGGMHGANNALYALKRKNDGELEKLELQPLKRGGAPEQRAQEIFDIICKAGHGPTLLAIDAPLSFPLGFRKLIGQETNSHPLPNNSKEGLIDNPLAFRDCERFVFRATEKRPLSASFDQLTSLTLLVLRVLHLLRVEYGKRLNVMPYNHTEIKEGINVFETYPALLNPDKTVVRKSDRIQVTSDKFFRFVSQHQGEYSSDHERDAQLCALFAAYSVGCREVLDIPIDFKGNVKSEGWIYWPMAIDLLKSVKY